MANIDESARTILETCAGLKDGARLFVAYDSKNDSSVERIIACAESMGIHTDKELISGIETREPPGEVPSKMLASDATIFCVNEPRTSIWGHSKAKDETCKNGGRVLFLTQDLGQTPNPDELYQIRAKSQKLGDLLEKTSRIDIVTGKNCELQLELAKGRKALRLSSILSSPGSWGAVPDYSESGIAPLEAQSNGVFRVDGMIVSLGKVDSPVELEFSHGNLVRVSGGATAKLFQNLLNKYGAAERILCEVGFGTNHLRNAVKGEFDDKKILGAVHIALGDNHTFGGANRADLHIDAMTVKPEVYFDRTRVDFRAL